MESIKVSENINIFGKEVMVKNYYCSENCNPYEEKEKPLKIRLSITPTSFCGAACPFCVASGTTDKKDCLDTKKLKTVLTELHRKNVISGIGITGGEPFTDILLLNEIVEMIFDIFGLEIEISINTNGIGLHKLEQIKRYLFIHAIHISRHHYDDKLNRKYFGTVVPGEEELKEIVGKVKDKRLFVFNCLLLRDGIGSSGEIKNFLEFAGRVGVPKVGFITPMVINPYTEKNQVSYRELFDRKDPAFLFTNGYQDFGFCHCIDGVYATEDGRLIKIYGRETGCATAEYARGLVYTADNKLKTGYGRDAIVIYEG
ncbi:MAG: radical SAM protein [Eubacterium sp.]|nr:radical SAM protein [Eubacterium sp.]